MKVSLTELKTIVAGMIIEAKKKKKKKGDEPVSSPIGQYEAAFDFSKPLGDLNILKQQGGSNFGPYTNTTNCTDNPAEDDGLEEGYLRMIVRDVMRESPELVESVWDSREPRASNIWEQALNKYTKSKKE